MRRRLSIVLVLVLTVSLVIGCVARQPAAPQPAAPAPKPAAPPVVIGVPTALGSIEGADSLRATQLAVEEINARGGVSVGGEKRPFEVVSIDTREHEPGIPVHDALAAVEKLIQEKKPHAILVGAFRSEVLLASMDLINKYKLPYITSIAMTPAFQQKILEDYDKYKYMFRTGLNAAYLVMYLSQMMKFLGDEFGFQRAYIVEQDVLWAKGTGGGLEKWLKENGWEVVGRDAYPTGATEFSSSVTRAREGKAQVIVPIFDMPQAGILVKQVRSMKVPALVAGFISPVAPGNAWQVFEGEVEGMVNFIFEIGPIAMKAVPKSIQFNENYGKRWGEDLRVKLSGHGPGPAYDSVYILADAIQRADSLDADKIVTALEATDMNGAIGRIRFGKDHQVIFGLDPQETAIGAAFQWRKPGVRVPVFPAAAAESKIELPPEMK